MSQAPHRRLQSLKIVLFFAFLSILALFLAGELGQGLFRRLIIKKIHPLPPMETTERAGAIPTIPAQAPELPTLGTVVQGFEFLSDKDLERWEKKIFKDGTALTIRSDEGGQKFLASASTDSCTGLYMKTNHTATEDLWISWRWRVKEFPTKKEPLKLSNRSADDFGARVYVIFEAANLFRSDVIEYIWDDSIPSGSYADSPYSDRIKLFVLRSGPPPTENDGWAEEKINPLRDYEKMFGKKPKNKIGIIALMSDSDNTRSRASADFQFVQIVKIPKTNSADASQNIMQS